MADAEIFVTLICVFIVVGVFLPYVNSSFDVSATTPDVQGFDSGITTDFNTAQQEKGLFGAVSIGDVAISILSMFFWTFGALPFWLDAFFIILRAIFLILLVKLIRGTG